MRIRIVVVGLLAVTLTIAALPVTRAAMDLPKWSAGDYWAYRFSISSPYGGTMNGTLRMDVTGTENVVVEGNTYATYAVGAVMNASYGYQTVSVSLQMWYRTSDLAVVRQVVDQSSMGYQYTMRTTYDPPLGMRWPLAPGASWSASSTVLIESQLPGGGWYNQTTSVTADYEVQAERQVAVPAGTFTAIGLHRSDGGMFSGSGATEYWSASVGNAVRLSPESSFAPTLDLTDYHHDATSWPSVFLTIAAISLPLAVVAALLVWSIRRPRRLTTYAAPTPPAPPMQSAGMPPPQSWQPPPPQQPPSP